MVNLTMLGKLSHAHAHSAPPFFQGRAAHLESIRGLASLQVLLLHIFSAFLPALALTQPQESLASKIHHSPLFFLYDGYSAVYIFFVLSGAVLTTAFRRQAHRPAVAMGARILRLAVPAIAACLFAYAVKAILGGPNVAAGQLTGSDWLANNWLPPAGLTFLAKDALLNSLALGYEGVSIFSHSGVQFLDPLSSAYVAPLWTLSAEMQGSLLVLLFVLSYRKSRALWWGAITIALVVLWRTHFLCFIAGHIAATAIGRRSLKPLPVYLALGAIAFGIFLCFTSEETPWWGVKQMCEAHLWVMLPCAPNPQRMFGALAIFLGVFFSAGLAKHLSGPPLVFLGKLSFSLYLVHWPILFGISSLVLLQIQNQPPALGIRLLMCGFALILSFVAALLFLKIDLWAISLARHIRETPRRLGTPRSLAPGLSAEPASASYNWIIASSIGIAARCARPSRRLGRPADSAEVIRERASLAK